MRVNQIKAKDKIRRKVKLSLSEKPRKFKKNKNELSK